MSMKFTLLKLLLLLLCFSACKKPKPVVFSGQFLLTKKNPVPLANRSIEIYQPGGNAIIMGSSGSSATTNTDNNGRFNIRFVPGSSYFAGFSGENNNPLTVTSSDGNPYFSRKNFPDSGFDPAKPIFVGKQIDTLVIKITCFKAITSTDTFELKGNTINAVFNKKYTGIIADSSHTFTLDTLYNALFTDYDCRSKTFINNSIALARLKFFTGNSTPYSLALGSYYFELSPEDEIQKEITFIFEN